MRRRYRRPTASARRARGVSLEDRLTNTAAFFAALAESGPPGAQLAGTLAAAALLAGQGPGGSAGSEIISLCCIGGALYLRWLTRSLIRPA